MQGLYVLSLGTGHQRTKKQFTSTIQYCFLSLWCCFESISFADVSLKFLKGHWIRWEAADTTHAFHLPSMAVYISLSLDMTMKPLSGTAGFSEATILMPSWHQISAMKAYGRNYEASEKHTHTTLTHQCSGMISRSSMILIYLCFF